MTWKDLSNWTGAVSVNDIKYANIRDVSNIDLSTLATGSVIELHPATTVRKDTRPVEPVTSTTGQYKITVKQYMTKPSTSDFDFMQRWNNNNPMPLRTMIGTKEKETRGMVYMKLHGDITCKQTQFCMKCGRSITNPISQFFGLGPECGGHNYVNPFESDEELNAVVEQYRKEYLNKITWEGWIIKSAIIEEESI